MFLLNGKIIKLCLYASFYLSLQKISVVLYGIEIYRT